VSSDSIRLELVIRGRVQGVWFRDSVRREAVARGLGGYAENRFDGSLAVVLEGDPDAVRAVADFCRTGPPRARVTAVDERTGPVSGLAGFEIR